MAYIRSAGFCNCHPNCWHSSHQVILTERTVILTTWLSTLPVLFVNNDTRTSGMREDFRSYGFVFRVLRIRGIVSRNVFKESRKTVMCFCTHLHFFNENKWQLDGCGLTVFTTSFLRQHKMKKCHMSPVMYCMQNFTNNFVFLKGSLDAKFNYSLHVVWTWMCWQCVYHPIIIQIHPVIFF